VNNIIWCYCASLSVSSSAVESMRYLLEKVCAMDLRNVNNIDKKDTAYSVMPSTFILNFMYRFVFSIGNSGLYKTLVTILFLMMMLLLIEPSVIKIGSTLE